MWAKVKLGEVCTFQNGRAFKKSEWSETGLPIIRIQNLKKVVTEHNFFDGEYDERILVRNGDLLLSWSGTVKPFIWCHDDALLNQHVFKVTVSKSLDQAYAYHLLNNILDEISKHKVGIGLQHITKKTFDNFEIILPPLAEQQRIVAKLDAAFAKIDEAISSVEAKEIEVQKLEASLLSSSLDGDAMEWKTVKLGSVANILAGQSPKGEYYNKEGKGTPFYQGKKDYGERYLKEPSVWTDVVTKQAEKDDILMSVRAPVGALNIATQKICIGRGLAAIRPSTEILHDFLFYSLLVISHQLEGNAGAIFNSINKSQIEAIEILLPSLAEQERIVAKLDAAYSQFKNAKESIAKSKANYLALKKAILKEELQSSEAA